MNHIINYLFTVYFITVSLMKSLVTSSLSLCVPVLQMICLNPDHSRKHSDNIVFWFG